MNLDGAGKSLRGAKDLGGWASIPEISWNRRDFVFKMKLLLLSLSPGTSGPQGPREPVSSHLSPSLSVCLPAWQAACWLLEGKDFGHKRESGGSSLPEI